MPLGGRREITVYDRVIVGSDGSPSALYAVDRAHEIAAAAEARIVVVAAYEPDGDHERSADRVGRSPAAVRPERGSSRHAPDRSRELTSDRIRDIEQVIVPGEAGRGAAEGRQPEPGQPDRGGQPRSRRAPRARCWGRCPGDREERRLRRDRSSRPRHSGRSWCLKTRFPAVPRGWRSHPVPVARRLDQEGATHGRNQPDRRRSRRVRHSRQALLWAYDEAAHHGASLTVVSTWHPPALPMTPPYGSLPPDDYEQPTADGGAWRCSSSSLPSSFPRHRRWTYGRPSRKGRTPPRC